MGSTIAKIAFVPPPPGRACSVLADHPNHRLLSTVEGTTVSMLHIPAPADPPLPSYATDVPMCAAVDDLVAKGIVSGAAVAGALPHMATAAASDEGPHVSDPADLLRKALTLSRKVIVFAHGNAEDLSNAAYYEALARDIGCSVVGFDYPGYGLSTGGAPSEEGAFACGEAVCDYLLTEVGIAEQDLIFVGRSLGSGTATYLATAHPRAHALVLLSPLTSCAGVASRAVGSLLSSVDIMNNLRRAPLLQRMPVVLFHGSHDSVIPPSHAVTLADAVVTKAQNPRVALHIVRGADHNDLEHVFGGAVAFSAQLRRFLLDPDQYIGLYGHHPETATGCWSSCG